MLKLLFFLSLSLLCGSEAALALPHEQTLPGRIDRIIEPYVKAGMFGGIVMVAEGDRVVDVQTYGYAQHELKVPMQRNLRFRIASISKPFTDAALADLVDRGVMRLDSHVSDFLPDFPRGSEITVRQILEETSGIPHTNLLPEYERARHMTLAQSIAILRTKPLAFAPGSKRGYSNGAYDVLAAMIERASGKPFRQQVQDTVLDPLHLTDTGWSDTDKVIPRMVESYTPGMDPGTFSRAAFYAAEKRPGGGAMYSTADDLLAFTRAYFWRGGDTSESLSNELFGEPDKQYQILGSQRGTYAMIFTDNRRKIAVIALANTTTRFDNLGRRLYEAAVNETFPKPIPKMVEFHVKPADRAFYDGHYRFRNDAIEIRVDADGDVIYQAEPDDEWQAALAPLTGGQWLHPVYDSICRFEGQVRSRGLRCRAIDGGRGGEFEIPRAEAPAGS